MMERIVKVKRFPSKQKPRVLRQQLGLGLTEALTRGHVTPGSHRIQSGCIQSALIRQVLPTSVLRRNCVDVIGNIA